MTRLPHDNRDVKGRDISTSQILEEVCSHPYCDVRGRENLEIHHIWPRSFLRGQPIEFVELWDGTVVGNQVYLCNAFQNGHHQKITENTSNIAWHGDEDDGEEKLGWLDYEGQSEMLWIGYLNPQPVLFDRISPPNAKHPLYGVMPGGDADYVLEELTEPSSAIQHTYAHVSPGEECPTCKRKVPTEKKKEKARNRVSKSIRVPKDEQENGVEVLEDMMEQVEEILRPGEKPRSPYYTVTDALGLVIVNKDVIL